jgi:DNA-binding IscR family transcriptional regulator
MSTSSRFAVAVHILTLLAQAEGPVPSSMIAGSVGTNPALIRRMIGALTEAGFVTTTMGSTGGAMLARPASQITLLEVFQATETTALITLHQSAPESGLHGGSRDHWRTASGPIGRRPPWMPRSRKSRLPACSAKSNMPPGAASADFFPDM